MNELGSKTRRLSDIELWSLFDHTRFAISRLRELELGRFGLTIEQSLILRLLKDVGGSISTKEIEFVTMRQRHSISTLISRMVKMRLITRVQDSDAKRFRIATTKEGKGLFRQVTTNSLKNTFSSLVPIERRQLSDCLKKLLFKSRNLLGIAYILSPQPGSSPSTTLSKKGDDNSGITDAELWSLFDHTRFAISRLRELELSQFGITIEQSSILGLLQTTEVSRTSGEIEDVTMRQQHSISLLINRMVKMGLVSQIKTPGEKKYQITITEKGQNLYQKITAVSLQMVLSSLTSRERRQFETSLNKLLFRARDLLGI